MVQKYGSQGTGTPCIRVCKLNSQGLCSGCFRTTEEISNWLRYTEEEKLSVIRLLERRKEFLDN